MVNRIATSQNSIRLVLVTVLLVTVFLLASCTGNTDDPGDRAPLIFAAASLADVLEDAAELYEEDTGKQVAFNFGGSIALANQIASFGAPADGFVFVGDRPVEVIEQAGLLPENGVTNLWANSLVVVAQKNTRSLASLNEIATEGMRVAIGDPVLAPAGSYSRQAL
ncbi:MAG: molybdate ABC transporter substrate-binding protein, partial [Chloroflexi bacterium]|nr:molybdate ABC transporter substrate-binding protein [Chloroflexota bacterium]